MFVVAAELTLDRLEERIVALAGDITRGMERWLALVSEFDRRGGARKWGFRGTAEWLAWRCAIGQRAAREHVRVARRLDDMPLVRGAFASGELSYSKVRALTRAAEHEDEAALLELARSSTAAQLERTVMSLRSAASADLEVANRGYERRYLEWWWDGDGSLRICGRLGAEDGAALIDALENGAEALHPVGGADRRPPRGARRADALTEIVLSGCPRAQVVLHVDPAALACTATDASERAGEICALEDGPAIPSETARRLPCDAEVIAHGRKRRVVSPAMRRSLELRDRGCRFPGCTRRHRTHAHHIEHWMHGGLTDEENLVLLCRFHHRLVHEEGFSVERRGADLIFRLPDRGVITDLPPPLPVAA